MREVSAELVMARPRVSILVTCFNLGQYLDEAVGSVLGQTFQDFEILLIDDGSTDPETVRRLDGYVRPKTTVFRTPNRGLAAARNFLIERAQGNYLCALDADDRLHPDFLARTVAILETDPSLTFVSTRLQMFGVQEGIWPATARCDLPGLLSEDTVITAALVRKAAVVSVGGYDDRMPAQGDEDWDLWITLVERGHKGVVLPDVLFYYRRRHGSMCVDCTTGQTHIDLVQYLIRKHHDSYRVNLLEVLLQKEAVISSLRVANVSLEAELASDLVPMLEGRQAELHALRGKLAHARRVAAVIEAPTDAGRDRQQELAALQAEYQRSLAEVSALRSSASWRVTTPLRALHELCQRFLVWSVR
jgi:glycosyltransferase involved in cell wall biosynthesis